METKHVVWTNENVRMMLHAMKDNIPERNRKNAYLKTQNTLDWNKVAFHSFSPEECRKKWEEILRKMRKVRTLAELIDEAAGAITEPSKNTEIHLEKPKKPPGPFAIYMKENMAGFRKNHPDVTARELLKLLNKEYKTLPSEMKAIYIDKFHLASEKYQQNMVEFRKQNPKGLLTYKYLKMQKRKRAAKNDSVTDNKEQCEDGGSSCVPPKPPINGYNLFCKEQAQTMEGVPTSQYRYVWSRRWRKLSDSEKEKYRTRCQKMKAIYADELHEYINSLDEKQQKELGIKRSQLRKFAGKDVTLFPGEPKMPSVSGNTVFYKEEIKRLKMTIPSSRKRFEVASKMWQKLSVQEKEKYNQKIHDNWGNYLEELQRWFKTLSPEEQTTYQERNPSKLPYFCIKKTECVSQERQCTTRTSDSEDEYIDCSSSSSSDDDLEWYEVDDGCDDDDDDDGRL